MKTFRSESRHAAVLGLLAALAWAPAGAGQQNGATPAAPPAGSGQAAGSSTQGGAAPAPGDAQAGQRIATQGIPASGVVACASCHGASGEGNAEAGFPRLAGQSAQYMEHQLRSYADGSRQNPVMMPIAKNLDEAQRRDVSANYEDIPTEDDQPPAAGVAGDQADARARDRGQQLVDEGDDAKLVQACVNCHGPGAAGAFPVFPYLAGQHAGYLASALQEFKNGARRNDPSGQMPLIARQLDDEDIAAVAAYLSRQPVRPPDRARVESSQEIRRKAERAAASARPSDGHDKPVPSGIGTEQGAPLTGGGQGPGGGGGGSGSGPGGGSGAGTTQPGQ